MKFRLVGCAQLAMLALTVICWMPALGARQTAQTPGQTKKVPTGYGLDKDQPFAGADPNGTGLPWKEPPAEEVDAAKKNPTPHLVDGHPDLTGFWAPAGWGYAVSAGVDSPDGKTHYTQRGGEGPAQSAEKKRELKNRLEGANLPPYKPDFVERGKYLGE